MRIAVSGTPCTEGQCSQGNKIILCPRAVMMICWGALKDDVQRVYWMMMFIGALIGVLRQQCKWSNRPIFLQSTRE